MTVVFEDRWLLVVDKPSGLPTQAPQGGGDNLYDRLCARYPYVGLHHRLDTGASGLLLFALDREVNRALAEGLRERRIVRRYRAILAGEVWDEVWDRPVDGKPASTKVNVVARRRGRTAVELELQTGRTHQIRIHAALAGAPVLGDRRYGDEAARVFPRLALHAAALGLVHPSTGEPLACEAPLPDDLAEAWSALVVP